MSTNDLHLVQSAKPLIRVIGLVDGFNLYHALDCFDHGINDADKTRYKQYKWLCITSLLRHFLRPQSEALVGVEYFTTYPTWDDAKRRRHELYVSAQKEMGVHVTFGEFKSKRVTCRAHCRREFLVNEEKQTDMNIGAKLLDLAETYDKAILLTADSDQVPAIKLVRKLFPQKDVVSLPPIGRKAKELKQACGNLQYKMTEQHLRDSQLPNPLPIIRNGKQVGVLVKPPNWSSSSSGFVDLAASGKQG